MHLVHREDKRMSDRLDELVERMKQGDRVAYFDILELYLVPEHRQSVRQVVVAPELGRDERLDRQDWDGLKASDPKRYVLLKLISMAVWGRSSTDPRDDWAELESVASFAREHRVESGQILDDVSTLSDFMKQELRSRGHLFPGGRSRLRKPGLGKQLR